MEWHEIEVDGRHTVKFADLSYVPLANRPQQSDNDELFIGKQLGGILRHGEWAWRARDSVLQIMSLRNGQTISSYEFCESRGYENCCIKCVEELFPNNPEVMLLAVVLESFRGQSGICSYVAIYSVEISSVLNCMNSRLHITCARFMGATACRRSLLQNFDGCLAVGSEEGVVVLLDLNIQKLTSMYTEQQEDSFVSCNIVDYSLPLTEIHRNFQQCQKDGKHFGLQIEVIESPCAIQSILPIDLILGLAIGLEDGRLALYDLAELQIFYVALPNHPEVIMSALVKMDFIEPPDDPRPCLYIWALHENGENLHAVLHSLMYEKRLIEDDESTCFETFQTSAVRLQLSLESTKSVALSCQAISTLSNHGEDDSNSLCAISWLSVLGSKNKLLIFDLNQWYKEEMPFMPEYGTQPNYLAGYIFNGECTGLHTRINPNSIAHFNSMQRFEEHFYPNSLSFEGVLLHTTGSRRYNWEGAQNRVINLLRSSNAAIFLEPNLYFNEIIRTRLMPEFIELNVNATFSRNAKYEILLSAALEHNCVSLLRDCAKSWIDGSFMGNFAISTGLSLSTLTDWIWKRATCIKTRCNDLCKSLFELGGYPLDSREQKALGFITRQLKLLADLLKEILNYAKKQIPERVWHDLENKYNSLCMASSYQEVLLWLLNIGLLPEASPHNNKINSHNDLIPYPYKQLKEFYKNKRTFFTKIGDSVISKKSGSCKLLFIDSFIEHVCKGNILQEYWLENEGNGLYPPNSLEAMLRVMLVPDLDYDNKCAILLYFFLDLNMAIDEEVYKDVVVNFIKFPSVFKLSAPLIKTVQAFWNLDHDHYLAAIDEFISPFNKNQCYPQWQVELLIEVLLSQKANNLALRVLESQPSLISPLLKLNTLLANELISEAFHFVRSKNDDTLLEIFFSRCLRNGQFGVIRDLALSEREGLLLQNILKKSKAAGAESLHFVYLLQNSKYIEAVSYMDELSTKARSLKSSFHQSSHMETPNLVLSAFNTTMTPVTQGLTDVYFRIKDKIKKKEIDNRSPVPLSCQLIKQNANSLLGGIYHSSALSAHFATYYWGEMEEQTRQAKHLLNSNNAPFLRRPQIDTNSIDYMAQNKISYAQPYVATEKRTLVESGVLDNELDDFEGQKIEHKLNPKKKRRLVGQEIVDDISHFMKMNKNLNRLNDDEFAFGQDTTNETVKSKRKNSIDLLTQPIKRDVKEFEDVTDCMPEIHSILKTHTPEPGQLTRVPTAEEEKNLRFKLPAAEDHAEAKQNESVNEFMDVEQKKSVEPMHTPKIKQFSRSVSEESENSLSNASEDEFYSPVSSQNNSILNSSHLSGPQPRKPLARLSTERSQKSLTPESQTKSTTADNFVSASSGSTSESKTPLKSTDPLENTSTVAADRKETSNELYVTAREMLSKPLKASSHSKQEISPINSGMGNIISRSTFARSKISEFLPEVSSSKIGAVAHQNSIHVAKLSECSTVLGSLTTIESTKSTSHNVFSMPSVPLNIKKSCPDIVTASEEQKLKMLETTLSMSSYDISILETTSVQQTQSSTVYKQESTKTEDSKGEREEVNEKEAQNKDDIKQVEETGHVIELQKSASSTTKHQEESNYDCIVLSSSSSSSSSSASSLLSPGISTGKEEKYDYFTDNSDMAYDLDDVNNDSEANSEFEDNDIDINDVHTESDCNEELSIEESSIEIDSVQFVEDSSDSTQHICHYLDDDSSSDDVKVIIEDRPWVRSAENIELHPVANEESSKEIPIDEKVDTKKTQRQMENDMEIVVTSTATSEFRNSKQLSSHSVNSSTEMNENIDENKLSDLKQDDAIMGISSYSEKEEKQNLINKRQDASTDKTEECGKRREKIVEATEEEEALSLRLEDSIDDSEVIQTEIKSNTEESDGGGKKKGELKDQDLKASTLVFTPSKDRTVKGSSMPLSDFELKVGEIEDKIHKQNEKEEALTVQNVEGDKVSTSTPIKRKPLRENSVSSTDLKIEATTYEKDTDKAKEEQTIESSPKNEKLKVQKVEADTASTPAKMKGKPLRKSSFPPTDPKIETTTKEKETAEVEAEEDKKHEENEKKEALTAQNVEADKASTSTPIKRKPLSESSVPRTDIDKMKEEQMSESSDKMEQVNTQQIEADTASTSTKMKGKPLRESLLPPTDLKIEATTKEKETAEAEKEKISETTDKMEKLEAQEIEADKACTSTPSKRKTLREPSMPPADLESIADETETKTTEKIADKESEYIVKTEKLKKKGFDDDTASTSTPRRQRTLRSSATPVNLELNIVGAISSPRRTTRGISVPPQTSADTEEFSNLTPRTRRNVRASSLQPKYRNEDMGRETSEKALKTQATELSDTRATRGASLSPGAVEGKISTRRRSILLDAINEDDVIQDSPSTRTRLRSRLNSMDSEQDSSIISGTDQAVKPKRTRKISTSNLNSSNEQPLTPKRTRRNSDTSQLETPRSLRSRSVITVQEEDDTESIPASPRPETNKRIGIKRKKSTSQDPTTESPEQILASVADVSYSSSRRLTRTQLAVMEKSTALCQALTKKAVATESASISPPLSKRSSKACSTRSSNVNAESDDAESVSSKVSTISSVTGTKRRVTRSSVKGKDDDDDAISVASSFNSEKHQRNRRSKDKSSPNTTLTTIPEEEAPIEPKKRGRPPKH